MSDPERTDELEPTEDQDDAQEAEPSAEHDVASADALVPDPAPYTVSRLIVSLLGGGVTAVGGALVWSVLSASSSNDTRLWLLLLALLAAAVVSLLSGGNGSLPVGLAGGFCAALTIALGSYLGFGGRGWPQQGQPVVDVILAAMIVLGGYGLPRSGPLVFRRWKNLVRPHHERIWVVAAAVVLAVLLGLAVYRMPILTNWLAQRHLQAARSALQANDLGAARRQVEQELARNPNSAAAHLLLAQIALQEGQTDQAIESFRAAATLDPGSSLARLSLARLLLDRQQAQEARIYLDQAARLSGQDQNAELHYLLGWAAAEAGDMETAQARYGRAIELDAQYAAAYAGLGKVYLQIGQLDQALASLEKAISLRSNDIEVYQNVGALYLRNNQFAQAASVLEQAMPLDEQDAETCYLLGFAYLGQGKNEQAESLLLRAAALQPQSVRYDVGLSYFYRLTEQLPKALNQIEHAIGIEPDNLTLIQFRAEVRLEAGQFVEALGDYQTLDAQAPNQPSVQSGLAYTLFFLGRLDEAEKAARRVIELSPMMAQGYKNLALVLHAQGQVEPALAQAQKAVQLAPDIPLSQYILGLCHKDLGHREQAVAAFQETLRLGLSNFERERFQSQAEAFLRELAGQ